MVLLDNSAKDFVARAVAWKSKSRQSHGQIERTNIKMKKKQWKRSANRKDLMIVSKI